MIVNNNYKAETSGEGKVKIEQKKSLPFPIVLRMLLAKVSLRYYSMGNHLYVILTV